MKAKRAEETAEEEFEARRGWIMWFKKRSHIHNFSIISKSKVSADVESIISYPEELRTD